MQGYRDFVERERRARLRWYALVSFGLAACAYLLLGFDRTQTLGYAVSCFVMLNLVNFRAIFSPLPPDAVGDRQITRE